MQTTGARDPACKEAGGSKVALATRADPLNCLKLLFSGELLHHGPQFYSWLSSHDGPLTSNHCHVVQEP